MKNVYILALLIGSLINESFSQVTYSFTTAGATGRLGPNQVQINTAYGPTNLNGLVTCTAGVQIFTIPVTSNYSIVAAGAGGGNANGNGGRGRIVSGVINLAAGTVIRVVVGQKGILTNSSGGGGGSFVTYNNNMPIIVGGGGAGFLGSLGIVQPLSDGNYGNNGQNSACGTGIGGVGGNGGSGTTNGWGGGGGGLNSNGTQASYCAGTGGMSFINGGNGGNTCNNTVGGFGGGGGTHGNTGGGGGGGGYSGGGGSNQNIGNNTGGGGGSYQDPGMNTLVNVGTNLNQGYVNIIQLCVPGAAPTDNTPAPNQTVCAGSTTTLTVAGTGTITWYATNTSTPVLGTGAAFVTPTLSPGTYSYFAAAQNTCSAGPRTAVIFTVVSGPTITVNSGTICPGDSFTMNPSGAVTYTYSGGNQVVSPGVNTSYTVTGTDPSGCVSNPGAIANVSIAPSPTITVNSGSICAGQSFTMFPGGAVSYTFFNGQPVVTPTANTSFSVIGTSAGGCVSTSPAVSNVTVVVVPTVSVTGPSAMCLGQSITLNGWGASTYSWSNGGVTQSIVVSPTANISFTVTGTNSLGCPGTPVVKNITVNPLPSVNVTATETFICKGVSVALTASGADTYSWNTGALTASISVTPSVSTTYTVMGTNNATGCYQVVTINIQVSPCTGLNSHSILNLSGLTVHPNPNNGEFIVELRNGLKKNISVYDMTGRLVYTDSSEDDYLKVNINSFANGIYYVKIQSDNIFKVIKIVKE